MLNIIIEVRATDVTVKKEHSFKTFTFDSITQVKYYLKGNNDNYPVLNSISQYGVSIFSEYFGFANIRVKFYPFEGNSPADILYLKPGHYQMKNL